MPEGDLLRGGAGAARGVDLAALAKGDWRDFNKRMLELAPVVNRVADAYKAIRAEQRRQISKRATTHDFMAEDGDVLDRLDRDRMLGARFMQATGQKMSSDDLKTFVEDKSVHQDSTIEMSFMIDGSGSMPLVRLAGGVTAMEVAMQSAAIGYMACRKAGIDSFIVMWGDPEPLVIATPGMDLKLVGERLETLRNGTKSGTSLAPGLTSAVGSLAGHNNKNGVISGSSHLQIYSDGDIFDADDTMRVLEALSRHSKNLSVDVAVIGASGGRGTKMAEVFQQVIDKTGNRVVGLLHGSDPRELPLQIARNMLARVRAIRVVTEPDIQKRKRLKHLHGVLKG
jgi:hypothetical protein